jgi:hypothetical protein
VPTAVFRDIIKISSGHFHEHYQQTDWFVEETKSVLPERETEFLGALTKLRKETINGVTSICLPVRPSVCPYETLRLPLDRFFMKFDI